MDGGSIKIWGMSYGLIGDLIMGLPMLTYFEKKFPGSYKYWVIEKKCAMTAPLYLNHPLIDRIKITDEWSGFGETDRKLINECDIICNRSSVHKKRDWYNDVSAVVETARLAGIDDIEHVLTTEELKPKLIKWFDVGFENAVQSTYSKNNNIDLSLFNKNIAIWPFTCDRSGGRCPSNKWWEGMISILIEDGYTVHHYGLDSEPILSNSDKYNKLTHMSFFQQIKASLSSEFFIGASTGPIWILGAYQHPGITLETYWMPGHNKNKTAVTPINNNNRTLFVDRNSMGCDAITYDKVISEIQELKNK